MLLLHILACILHQELLRGVGEGNDSNIFHSHQLLVKVIILVSAVLSVRIFDVRSVGSSNSYMEKRLSGSYRVRQNYVYWWYDWSRCWEVYQTQPAKHCAILLDGRIALGR